MKMECNVGGTERYFRLAIGIVFVALSLFGVLSGAAALIGYIIGAIGLITGIMKYCPLNSLMGRNTCQIKIPAK